mmetsp:Transcript_39239/g.122786  ORF Transcript_39239/g.122786 Transcript_39239/m.122786 type:complete len:142 (-) Transcript_39239:598-1023(-)
MEEAKRGEGVALALQVLVARDTSTQVLSFLSLKDVGRLRRVCRALHAESPPPAWRGAIFAMSKRLRAPVALRAAETDLHYWTASAVAVQGGGGGEAAVLTGEVYVLARGGDAAAFAAERQSYGNAQLWHAAPLAPMLPGTS